MNCILNWQCYNNSLCIVVLDATVSFCIVYSDIIRWHNLIYIHICITLWHHVYNIVTSNEATMHRSVRRWLLWFLVWNATKSILQVMDDECIPNNQRNSPHIQIVYHYHQPCIQWGGWTGWRTQNSIFVYFLRSIFMLFIIKVTWKTRWSKPQVRSQPKHRGSWGLGTGAIAARQ